MTIYWSITTLTTTGYGDIHPVNSIEMIFDVVYMLFNLALTSYIIGNMSSLVVHGTNRTRRFVSTSYTANHLSTFVLISFLLIYSTHVSGISVLKSP